MNTSVDELMARVEEDMVAALTEEEATFMRGMVDEYWRLEEVARRRKEEEEERNRRKEEEEERNKTTSWVVRSAVLETMRRLAEEAIYWAAQERTSPTTWRTAWQKLDEIREEWGEELVQFARWAARKRAGSGLQ